MYVNFFKMPPSGLIENFIAFIFLVEPESDICGLPDDTPQVAEVRHRLLFFLKTSNVYAADRMLAHLPNEGNVIILRVR